MTRTLPEPVRAARLPSVSSIAGTGTARMGRTREKNANRIKVSLYIVKRWLGKARRVPGGVYDRLESGVRVRRRDASV
jgi:hypothetical protein